ncbi:MAG: PEP-CTERM sorting domain-containing protein [Verrucomicrobia bacterium]|nr:PEP-CTERM sorting domain-containing protein [Verrucomicrobiota bacterium]
MKRRSSVFIVLLGTLTLAVLTQAATNYWDNGGTTNIWTTVGNWDTSPDGTGGDPGTVTGAGYVGYFNIIGLNSDVTVMLNANLIIGGLVFNTFGATTFVTDGSNRRITIGEFGLTIHGGAGPVTIGSSVNTLRIPWTLSASQTWQNNSDNTFTIAGSQAITLNDGVVWTIDGSGDIVLGSGAIGLQTGGTAAHIVKNGTGAFQTGANNTFTGSFTLNSGSLRLGNDGAVGNAANILTLNGGTLTSGGTGNRTIANPVNFGGAVQIGAETAYTGTYTFNGSTALTTNSALTTVVDTTFNGNISETGGSWSLTKFGAATMVLNGVNTYTGGTIVNEGVLTVFNTNALPNYNAPGQLTVASNAVIGVRVGGAGEWDAASVEDMLTNANMAAGAFLGFDTTSGDVPIADGLSDTAVSIGIAKLGSGLLTLSGSNDYTGGTMLKGGILSVGSYSNLPSAGPLIFDGGILQITGTEIADLNPYLIHWQAGGGGLDVNDASHTVTVSNSFTGTGGLTKTGLGTMVLSNNAVTIGNALIVEQGHLILDNAAVTNTTSSALDCIGNTPGNTATLTLQGNSVYSTYDLRLGTNATSKGILVIKDNALIVGRQFFLVGHNSTGIVYMTGGAINNVGNNLRVGNVGVGAFYQSGGTVYAGTQTHIGYNAGGYGFYQMTGGTLSNAQWVQIGTGAANNPGLGVLYQTGGEILTTHATQGILLGNNTGTGVVYQTGGIVSSVSPLYLAYNNGGSSSYGVYTICGTATAAVGSVNFNNTAAATAVGILNLTDNAVLQAGRIYENGASGLSIVNFNGAVLRASANATNFMQGLDYANVFSGGAIIDSSTNTITIAQNLLAPSGQGITNIPWAGDLTGYIGAPYVDISGGNGTGATAVAIFDYTTGSVTGIVITSAGFGYQPGDTPTVTLVGGGNSNYVVGAASVTDNSSGGLTKLGTGILTLTGTNTYTGGTAINEGVLSTLNTDALPQYNVAGKVTVASNAVMAFRVGGAGEWDAAQIQDAATNATLTAGALLGFDTTSGNVAIANTLSGPIGYAKLGANTLSLTGANDYTGPTWLYGGTLSVETIGDATTNSSIGWGNELRFSNAGTLQVTGSGNYTTGRNITNLTATTMTLDITNSAATLTINGNVQGSTGTVTKEGLGTLVLAGTNNANIIYVNTGTLTLAGDTTTGGNIGVGRLAGVPAVLNIQSGTIIPGANLIAGNLANSTGIVYQTGGTVSPVTALQVGGTAGSYGEYHLYGGTLNAGANLYICVNANTIGIFEMTNGIMTASTLQIARNNNANGWNQLAYYYQSGGTATVTTLHMLGAGASPGTNTAHFIVSNGVFSATTFSSLAAARMSTGHVYFGQGALVTLPAFPTTRGEGSHVELTFDGGQLTPLAASANYMSNLTRAVITTNGVIFNTPAGRDITIAQNLEDATGHNGTLTKTGDAVLTLTGTNTYTGGTVVQAGALVAAHTNALPRFDQSGNVTVASNAAIVVRVGGAGEWDAASIDALLNNASLADGAAFGFDTTSGDYTSATLITGNIGLIKLGANALTIANANTHAGGAMLVAGSIRIGHNDAFGTGTLTLAGGTLTSDGTATRIIANPLQLDGNIQLSDSINIGWLVFTGSVTLTGDRTITVVTNAAFTGVVSGDYNLIKTGSGALILSNANTYTGNTTINAGLIRAANNDALGASGTITLNGSGAKLELADGITISQPLIISNTGNDKTLRLQNGATTGAYAGDITINETGTDNFDVTVFSGGTLTISGLIGGTGTAGLTKGEAGTLILTATNTYTGRTLINRGTLIISVLTNAGAASSIGTGTDNPSIRMGNAQYTGTLLYIGEGTATDRPIQIGSGTASETGGTTIRNDGSGPIIFTAPNFNTPFATATANRNLTLGGSNADANEIQGIIADNNYGGSGTVGLIKTNAGHWILSGANTYTGPTAVNGGTLSVNGAISNSAVTVRSGGTFGGNGFVANLTINAGGLSPGNSAGTLTVGDLTLTNNPTLIFDLGTASDMVIVTQLKWTGLMETNWFILRDAGGLTENIYTLFQATTLNGALGAGTNFTNIAGTGRYGSLFIEGNDIKLTVIPEPGSAMLVGAGLLLMVLLRRRRS